MFLGIHEKVAILSLSKLTPVTLGNDLDKRCFSLLQWIFLDGQKSHQNVE